MTNTPSKGPGGRSLGVCSWSLLATSPAELVERTRAAGLDAVQLALDPVRRGDWNTSELTRLLADAGVRVLSGMMGMEGEDYSTLDTIRRTGGVVPDEHWPANLAAARDNARLARELGLDLVSFHAGFLPEEPGPQRTRLIGRLRELVDVFSLEGVRTAFETGQEHAETLAAFLDELDRDGAGVNFDPAIVILYDVGEPIAALERLAPWVRQIHVKDARRTQTPGTWGEEVPAGLGDVDWDRFFDVIGERRIDVDLVIEREAGDERVADVARARELVSNQLERLAASAAAQT